MIGDAAARDLRATAVLLDQFRSAVSLVLPSARHLTVPTNVFVFKDRKAMLPFLPLYNGKPAEVGGMFMGSSDVNYIEVTASQDPDDQEATRTILHKYHTCCSRPPPRTRRHGSAKAWRSISALSEWTARTSGGRHRACHRRSR